MRRAIFRLQVGKLTNAVRRACCRKYCTAEEVPEIQKTKDVHPFRRLHPWKSSTEFTASLLKNIIYNADGIIAINKPYGISVIPSKTATEKQLITNKIHQIVNKVDYSVQDVLPQFAKELDVPYLIPCTGAEKYMSGIYVFGVDNKACDEIKQSKVRAIALGKFPKYWGVTTRIPHHINGSYHLAMTMQKSSLGGNKKPVILSKWSKNAMKRNDVKILNVDYKLLANSTHNLSSLIELGVSTRRWHAIRLFASTMLYSPILGDNYHGSRVQQLMGTWIRVDPFAESCWDMPKLNPQLLNLLHLTPNQQEIIPPHTHLKQIELISFGKEKKNIVLEAPLTDYFDWTCKQLMFKISDEMNYENTENRIEGIALA